MTRFEIAVIYDVSFLTLPFSIVGRSVADIFDWRLPHMQLETVSIITIVKKVANNTIDREGIVFFQ